MLMSKKFYPNTLLKKFLTTIGTLILILAVLFYWKEGFSSQGIHFVYVLFWQLLIWSPWILVFKFAQITYNKYEKSTFNKVTIALIIIACLGIHIGWFFTVSINFSPYRNLPDACYGTHPYVFILWTLIDLLLVKYTLELLTNSKKGLSKKKKPLFFELNRGNEKYICNPRQIYWLKAENYYTKFSTDKGIFLCRKPLKSFELELPKAHFFRIHRSTIINVNFLDKLIRDNKNNLDAIMKDDSKHRVSRSFAKDLKDLVNRNTL